MIETTSAEAVAEAVKTAFSGIGEQDSFPLIDRLFYEISAFFEGRRAGYKPSPSNTTTSSIPCRSPCA